MGRGQAIELLMTRRISAVRAGFWIGGIACLVICTTAVAMQTRSDRSSYAATGADCRGPSGRLVAEDRSAVVYTLDGDLIACRRGQKSVVLATQIEDEHWFTPPALSLVGSLVGFAYGTADYGTVIRTEDPGDYLGRRHRVIVSSASGSAAYFRVGSLATKTSTGVAWIQCPARNPELRPIRSPYPNCVKAGRSTNSVYKADAGDDKPVLLDRGRQVDPRSLKISSSTLRWQHGGRTRTAPLR
jgi:hypothetical protein